MKDLDGQEVTVSVRSTISPRHRLLSCHAHFPLYDFNNWLTSRIHLMKWTSSNQGTKVWSSNTPWKHIGEPALTFVLSTLPGSWTNDFLRPVLHSLSKSCGTPMPRRYLHGFWVAYYTVNQNWSSSFPPSLFLFAFLFYRLPREGRKSTIISRNETGTHAIRLRNGNEAVRCDTRVPAPGSSVWRVATPEAALQRTVNTMRGLSRDMDCGWGDTTRAWGPKKGHLEV